MTCDTIRTKQTIFSYQFNYMGRNTVLEKNFSMNILLFPTVLFKFVM